MTTPKFGRDPRVEALYAMSLQGWFTDQSGDVESPTGWFAWTEIRADEVAEIGEAFEAEFGDIAESDDELRDLLASLVGGWLLFEDEQGFVSAVEYPLTRDPVFGVSASAPARVAFDALDAEYATWCDDDGTDSFTSAGAVVLRDVIAGRGLAPCWTPEAGWVDES